VSQGIQLSRTNARGLNSREIAVLDRQSSAQLLGCQPDLAQAGAGAHNLNLVKSSSVGDLSEGGTPGPIPNPAVKPFRADGSWGASLCESRSSPTELFLFN
jgi:hypothetical protein